MAATGLIPIALALHSAHELTSSLVPMDIDLVQPVPRTDGWKSLVLPTGHKQIVQAMVDTHSAGPRIRPNDAHQMPEVDLVRGKGKGCIILIHGAPGVGKTSTAGESPQELTLSYQLYLYVTRKSDGLPQSALRHILIGHYFRLHAVS